jgi:hypothetical protein
MMGVGAGGEGKRLESLWARGGGFKSLTTPPAPLCEPLLGKWRPGTATEGTKPSGIAIIIRVLLAQSELEETWQSTWFSLI